MPAPESIALLERFLAARNAKDLDTALACVAEDVELDASRRILDPMVLHGHDGFLEFVRQLDEVWASQDLEPLEFIEAGDRIVVPVRLVSTGHSGATVNAHPAWVFAIEDGRIAHLRVYQSREEALDGVRGDG